MQPSRRKFIRDTSLLAAAGITGSASAAGGEAPPPPPSQRAPVFETPSTKQRGNMLYRQLGNTGVEVSLVGLGGYHIGTQETEDESIRIIRTAIDRGITFLDNCWDYNRGESERRMGLALQDGYRNRVFVMSKIDGRNRAAATKQINESLERLKVERIDLMQFHEIIQVDAPDRIFNEGAWDALHAAQKAGKVRFVGFTGHKDPLVHLRMLDVAQQHGVRFDAVQMPINVMDAHFRSFTNDVLPRLVKEQIGVLAMKPFGGGRVVQEVLRSGTATAIELQQYVMSLPVSVMITGMERMERLDQACEAARTFKPLSAEERNQLVARVSDPARTGKFEGYKTTAQFDATTYHPEWLEAG